VALKIPSKWIPALWSLLLIGGIAAVWNPFVGEKCLNMLLEAARRNALRHSTARVFAASPLVSTAGTDRRGKIYLVVYTTGNPEGGDIDFQLSAQTRADDIQHAVGFDVTRDVVLLRGVRTRVEFESVVNTLGDHSDGAIQELTIYSHGALDGPIFHGADGKQEQYEDFMENLDFHFAPHASANFMGCTSAGFAQGFADAHRVNAYGFLTRTIFSGAPDTKTYTYLLGLKEYTLGSKGRLSRLRGEAIAGPELFLPLPWWMH